MKYLHLIIISIFLATGCKEEKVNSPSPDPVDLRDDAVGTYSGGQIIVYNLDGEVMAELDKSFTVSKGSESSIIFIDVEGDIIKGEKIIDSGDGFVFDLVEGSWGSFNITGNEAFENNGSSYSGMFKKELLGNENLFSVSMGLSAGGGDVYIYYELSGFLD
jgi:hypothetical protein